MVFWPVAALAVLLLGFVVAYGSTLQSRLESSSSQQAADASVANREAAP